MPRTLLLAAASLTPHLSLAEPVTPARIQELPAAEQPAWKAYLEKSQATAAADAAALKAELAANNLQTALKTPNGGDFKLSKAAGDPWYGGEEAKALADVILSYQAPSGGWSKHLGFGEGPRKPGMQWTSQSEPGQPPHYLATFDNGSTVAEMAYLANVWLATKREDCKAAFIKGLAFIAAAQFPNGGWPQVYPLEGKYHDDVTHNDNATTNILELLRDASSGQLPYAFLDDAQRKLAADVMAKGIANVVRTQVEINGTKAVWCSQFDPITLLPTNARKMEPATLSGLESARTLKFLMTLPNPTPEVVACIESGLKWMEAAKITGIGTKEVDGKTIYVADPAATEVRWARFYDLKTGKPVFPGRDGIQYDTFEAMAANNKLGYDYYTSQPASILTNGQKKWRKTLASSPAAKP